MKPLPITKVAVGLYYLLFVSAATLPTAMPIHYRDVFVLLPGIVLFFGQCVSVTAGWLDDLRWQQAGDQCIAFGGYTLPVLVFEMLV
jgi:hypothetical protein